MPDQKTSRAGRMDVSYVARLAMLDLAADEKAMFQRQLDDIVGYVNKISELDLSSVEPTSHAVPLQNVLRQDDCRPGLDKAAVIENAPEHSNDQFLVPKIVE